MGKKELWSKIITLIISVLSAAATTFGMNQF